MYKNGYDFFRQNQIYFIFIFIFSPIFISLDFSQGLKFDAYIKNLYSHPSIPFSFFILGLFSLFNIKQLMGNKNFMILSLIIFIYIALNLYNEIIRGAIVGLGMLLPLASYYTLRPLLVKNENAYHIMYVILFGIIVIKFLFDLFYLHIYNPDVQFENLAFVEHWNFNTIYYLITPMVIYSYEDYFPIIYYIAIVLSLHNLVSDLMTKRSLLLIIISILAVTETGSRLFIHAIYLVPLLYIFYRMSKLELKTYLYLFIFSTLSITILMGFFNLGIDDESLAIRNMMVYDYFIDFTFENIFFPFTNQYRVDTAGSFHNEFLEIFSFFGLVAIYYYYLIMQIFVNVDKKYKMVSFFLMFIIVIGALIQINISNPYVGIMLGMVLAVLSSGNRTEIENAKI